MLTIEAIFAHVITMLPPQKIDDCGNVCTYGFNAFQADKLMIEAIFAHVILMLSKRKC